MLVAVHKPLYKIGDNVSLKADYQSDLAHIAIEHLKEFQSQGVVKEIFASTKAVMYSIEFPMEFPGGHDCWHTCLSRRGQFVMEQNLELENFETNRIVNTVPNLGGLHEEERRRRTDDTGTSIGADSIT